MPQKEEPSSWPDTLFMESIQATHSSETITSTNQQKSVVFSIASFNILAEAYLTPRSHKNLPPSSAKIVFDKVLRRKLLCDTLTKLTESFDILCLQELDSALQDVVFDRLGNLGYSYVHAPRGGIPVESSDVKINNRESPWKKSEEHESLVNVRSDGCATFFSKKHWKCVDYTVVNFDDLADEDRPVLDESMGLYENKSSMPAETTMNGSMKKSKHNPISGIITSYKRRNTALIVELEHATISGANHLVIANSHLYWHPGYEYVKLSQAHYLLHRVKQFVKDSKIIQESKDRRTSGSGSARPSPLVLICGDMNSKPKSIVHQYFTQGEVDARLVAPWNFYYDEVQEQEELAIQMQSLSLMSPLESNDSNEDLDQDPVVGIEVKSDECAEEQVMDDDPYIAIDHNEVMMSSSMKENIASSTITGELEKNQNDIQATRYLLDVTLNKFSRWLRILGLDAVLETAEEEKLRTGEGKLLLFERCRKDKRNLITTSKTLLARKDCPPGTYLVNPSTTKSLEENLVNLLLLHGVTLYPDQFLTRCVVCNGTIVEVFDGAEQMAIFEEYGSPNLMEELDHVYRCDSCGQGYWWSSAPTSSASRVKDACTHLLKLCLRGGVQVEGQPEFFSHVNYDEERALGQIERSNDQSCRNGVMEVLTWLKNKSLRSPFDLKSAYAVKTDGKVDGEMLPFTNVTSDFVGALDYIFFEKSKLQQLGRFTVPTTFRALNPECELNGHLLPSKHWPSDHLCIGAKFSFIYTSQDNNDRNFTSPLCSFLPEVSPVHPTPQLGCDCGCIPKVLSLFQMAELRKQARQKKAAMEANSS